MIRKQRKVKVVNGANEREWILKACHSEPMSGLTKTWKRIAEQFYWKGIVSDVRQLVCIMKSSLQTSCFTLVRCLQVLTCPECQKMNKKLERGRPELHPVAVKSPWNHLGMDFIGPISPTSTAGNC